MKHSQLKSDSKPFLLQIGLCKRKCLCSLTPLYHQRPAKSLNRNINAG